jgi:preprotein translocase subunit YajC
VASASVAFPAFPTIFRRLESWGGIRGRAVIVEEFYMFISQAFAQDTAGGASAFGSGLEMLFLFAPLMVVWYFFLIRPQRAQMKKRQETLTNIRRGDQVVLGGGIVGKVTKVIDDNELEVEIAEGVKIRAARAYIAEVRVKGEVVKTEAAS